MPELRKDPIVGRWVIIATDRAQRPTDYGSAHAAYAAAGRDRGGVCPFCPGHEDRTPRELLAYRPESGPGARRDAPGWNLRAFPNKYPALMIEGGLDREGDGLYDRMNGVGAHEVIVETPDHARQLADLDVVDVERVLHAWCDRMIDLRNDRRFRYVLVFKNHGIAAGASVEHSHSQLIALPTVPTSVSDELEGAGAYYRFKERCLFCDIVRQESAQRTRLVYENPDFIVVEPFAARSPFETWILPRRHRSAFEYSPIPELGTCAQALRAALRKLRRALDDPPYNFVLHTSPVDQPDTPSYHWHIEIQPAFSKAAGFELGSGFHINPTPPEEAAQFLRDLDEE